MYEVSIVGTGIVGLVNALLLAKSTSLSIALIDAKAPLAQWSVTEHDPRVYALTPASQQILKELAVWPFIEARRAAAFTDMQVWDAEGGGEIQFNHAEVNVPALGYIVEENLIRAALYEKIAQESKIKLFSPVSLLAIEERETGIQLTLSAPQEMVLHTRLLVGADGAHSVVREKAGLRLHTLDYQHSSLISQVQTDLPHQKTARQAFLSAKTGPTGPLAFLPLQDPHQCSIVWSSTPPQIEKLLMLDDASFQKILAEAFDFRLGKINAVSKRYAFPLYERHVENYVKNRIALIGDAAHTLHPLAGQGVNLGIADAACLAETVLLALQKGRDYSSFHNLRRYERARKGNNVMMLQAVKLLKALFTSEKKGIQVLRSQGLNLSNRFSLAKALFANYAMS